MPLTSQVFTDANGQNWALTVNIDGTMQLTETTLPATIVNPDDSTLTVQSVINYCMTHTELMPLVNVAGFTDEPALSIANDTLASILSSPFPWKFNRVVMNLLVTQQNKQDYLFAGATAFVLKGSSVIGGVGIDLASNGAISESGNTVTVNTLEQHNFSVGDTVYMVGNTYGQYNSTETITPSSSQWSGGWVITAVPSSKSFQFTHASSGLPGSGAPGISDFGWLEYGTFVDENETSAVRFVRELEAVRSLQPMSLTGIPAKVAVHKVRTLTGVVFVRFANVPSTAAYGVKLVYQKKAPVLTAILNSTWSPIPDEFAFVIRQMFLAQAFRYVGSARETAEFQKAQIAMQKALGRDDAEASEEFIAPENPLMGWF